MRLQFVAIEASGASTTIEKVPDALRVDLILGNPKEAGSASGGYSRRASTWAKGSDPFTRAKRRLAHGAL